MLQLHCLRSSPGVHMYRYLMCLAITSRICCSSDICCMSQKLLDFPLFSWGEELVEDKMLIRMVTWFRLWIDIPDLRTNMETMHHLGAKNVLPRTRRQTDSMWSVNRCLLYSDFPAMAELCYASPRSCVQNANTAYILSLTFTKQTSH